MSIISGFFININIKISHFIKIFVLFYAFSKKKKYFNKFTIFSIISHFKNLFLLTLPAMYNCRSRSIRKSLTHYAVPSSNELDAQARILLEKFYSNLLMPFSIVYSSSVQSSIFKHIYL